MDKWIEALANGNFEAVLALVTTLLSSGFGTILVIVATKFLNYKKSVSETMNELKSKILPEFEEIVYKVKNEIVEEVKGDFKVIAESIALSTDNDSTSKIAVIENVSKIGVSKKVKEKAIKAVEEEIATKEEKKEELNKVVKQLEVNTLTTL